MPTLDLGRLSVAQLHELSGKVAGVLAARGVQASTKTAGWEDRPGFAQRARELATTLNSATGKAQQFAAEYGEAKPQDKNRMDMAVYDFEEAANSLLPYVSNVAKYAARGVQATVKTAEIDYPSDHGELMSSLEMFYSSVQDKILNGDVNGAAQELRLAAEHLERGGASPRVLHRNEHDMGDISERTLAKLYARCGEIARGLGHRVAGLKPALAAGDLPAARILLDRYLADKHKLPSKAASWHKLEADLPTEA